MSGKRTCGDCFSFSGGMCNIAISASGRVRSDYGACTDFQEMAPAADSDAPVPSDEAPKHPKPAKPFRLVRDCVSARCAQYQEFIGGVWQCNNEFCGEISTDPGELHCNRCDSVVALSGRCVSCGKCYDFNGPSAANRADADSEAAGGVDSLDHKPAKPDSRNDVPSWPVEVLEGWEGGDDIDGKGGLAEAYRLGLDAGRARADSRTKSLIKGQNANIATLVQCVSNNTDNIGELIGALRDMAGISDEPDHEHETVEEEADRLTDCTERGSIPISPKCGAMHGVGRPCIKTKGHDGFHTDGQNAWAWDR